MLKIGVVGLGFGINLFNTLISRDDVLVAGVADYFDSRRNQVKVNHPSIPCFAQGYELIEQVELDAVIVATAPDVRDETIKACIAKGLPIFMEKPIAGTPQSARSVIELCGDHPVMMGYSFRFHPVFKQLKDLIGTSLGQPILLNGQYLFDWLPDSDNWLWNTDVGGGFFNENSCHLFDAVCQLMGTPKQVFAFAPPVSERPSETSAAVTIQFQSGSVAALTIGGIASGAIKDFPKIDVICTQGQAHLQGYDHTWQRLKWTTKGSQCASEIDISSEQLNRTRYSDGLEHFIESIQNGTPFQSTLHQGLLSSKIAQAIYLSLSTGLPQEL